MWQVSSACILFSVFTTDDTQAAYYTNLNTSKRVPTYFDLMRKMPFLVHVTHSHMFRLGISKALAALEDIIIRGGKKTRSSFFAGLVHPLFPVRGSPQLSLSISCSVLGPGLPTPCLFIHSAAGKSLPMFGYDQDSPGNCRYRCNLVTYPVL